MPFAKIVAGFFSFNYQLVININKHCGIVFPSYMTLTDYQISTRVTEFHVRNPYGIPDILP